VRKNLKVQEIKYYLPTNRTAVTSLHPLIYATKMIMVITFCHYLWILFSVFCKENIRRNIRI